MNALDIAREYFPGEDEGFLGMVIWTFTGYPYFFHGDPVDCMRQQIAEVKDILDRCAPLMDDVERYQWHHGGRTPWDEEPAS
jgi:hypothetical protein